MTPSEIAAAVAHLVGRQLTIARRAASMRVLHFGAVTEGADGSWGEWALHLQCPWRLDGPDGAITGADDLWEHAEHEVPPEGWSYVDGGSLQDARLRALLGGYDVRTRSAINVRAGLLWVTAAEVSERGDLALALAGGYTLRAWPAGTRGEAWRLLAPGTDAPHVVFPSEPGALPADA